jgi:hypothetical protein
MAWVDSSGAERVLSVGSIEASDVLLRLLSTLSGIPINATESDARTLPRDLRVVVISERSMPLNNTAALREPDREGRYARVGLGVGRAGLAHLFFKIM